MTFAPERQAGSAPDALVADILIAETPRRADANGQAGALGRHERWDVARIRRAKMHESAAGRGSARRLRPAGARPNDGRAPAARSFRTLETLDVGANAAPPRGPVAQAVASACYNRRPLPGEGNLL